MRMFQREALRFSLRREPGGKPEQVNIGPSRLPGECQRKTIGREGGIGVALKNVRRRGCQPPLFPCVRRVQKQCQYRLVGLCKSDQLRLWTHSEVWTLHPVSPTP